MYSPSDSLVSSTVASIESASPRPEAREPWLPEPEELPSVPWRLWPPNSSATSPPTDTMERVAGASDIEVVGLFASQIAAVRFSRLLGLPCSSRVATRGSASVELGLVTERVGLVSMCVEELREWPVWSWALALKWGCHPRRCQCGTGLKCRAGRACVCVRRRATRVASGELSFSAQVGLSPEEVPARNWA
ncbi:hypothetical protein F511_37590 [Dorcoceras hygrometricum]|uniref:Uncharacterized protein n=1 Tax=Dorcoceras hygrometricum TaxID=472368 RepID=A0A2Z7AP66_9LAMI|nr:hypothetical protein F511_37590 [Dorcoceras hygrometricum]